MPSKKIKSFEFESNVIWLLWLELHEIVSAECESHAVIDNTLRAYLSFTAKYKGPDYFSPPLFIHGICSSHMIGNYTCDSPLSQLIGSSAYYSAKSDYLEPHSADNITTVLQACMPTPLMTSPTVPISSCRRAYSQNMQITFGDRSYMVYSRYARKMAPAGVRKGFPVLFFSADGWYCDGNRMMTPTRFL